MVKHTTTVAEATQTKTVGKGWHGDPAGHARAGRKGGKKSSGNFRNDPDRASAAGRLGGRMSPGNFKNNPERARAAGRKGGSKHITSSVSVTV